VVAAIRHLREVFGMPAVRHLRCLLDARTSLSAVRGRSRGDRRLVFMAAPVMELDTVVQVHTDTKDWAHVWKALRKAENWRALVRPNAGAMWAP